MKLRLRGSLWRNVTELLAIAVIAELGCPLSALAQGKAPKASAAVPVRATAVVHKAVPLDLHNFGMVDPLNTVAVKSLVGGTLLSAKFADGQDVAVDDVLFTVDPQPFQIALNLAEANLARDTALYENAQKEATRQSDLLKKGYSAQGAYDQARANADAAAASMRADQAAIDNAKLQLGYCTIKSPIRGRAGARLVDVGNVVKPNDATLVVINQMSPIYVTFSVPQQNLAAIRKWMSAGKVQARAVIPGQEDKPEEGELVFVDNAIDAGTGTIGLKALFENRETRLWPGQFVTVTVTLTVEQDKVVVPSRAIQTGQAGQYVFVIREDMTAEQRPVTVERVLNSDSVISKGVEQGETIVTDGQLRLVPDAKVEVLDSSDSGGVPKQ
jgi:multidrug efflux system membrane fusion protein